MTAQSVTCQPQSPARSVSRTVSSTARKNASGIDPSSTSSRNVTPEPTGAGSTRSPTVARNGFGRLAEQLDGRAGADGRSTQIVVVSRKLDLDAEVGRQRRLDDLLLHLAVERDRQLVPDVVLAQVDQRVLLGELGERDMQRDLVRVARARRPSPASAERTGAAAALRVADRVADPDSPRPQTLPISPRGDRARCTAGRGRRR